MVMDARISAQPPFPFYPSMRASRSDLLDHVEYVCCICGIFLCAMIHFRSFFLVCAILAIIKGGLSFQPFGRSVILFWMVGLFLMLAGLSIAGMLSADPLRGMIVVGQYAFAFIVVPLVFFDRTLEKVVTLAKIYIFSIVVICLHGIYLIHIDGSRFTVFVTGSGRFAGLMERANECATVIALSVPIVLLVTALGYISRPVALVCIALMAYGILLTGSNTGLLSLVYGLGIFAVFGVPWRRMLIPLAIVALMLPVGGEWISGYMPEAFQKRVLTALETGDISQAGTFDGRVELIYEALEMTDRTAIIGIGPDQYRVQSALRAPVHNVYLLLWTEGGIIALFGFILILLGALGSAVSALKDGVGRPFAAAIFANVTMFIFAANALPHVYSRFWLVPIVLPMALAAYTAIAKARSPATTVNDWTD
jgi:O-antigen ligase